MANQHYAYPEYTSVVKLDAMLAALAAYRRGAR